MPLFQSSETIMAYWSMDDEVFTHDFILKYYKQKQIILPVVKGDTLVLKNLQAFRISKKEKHTELMNLRVMYMKL